MQYHVTLGCWGLWVRLALYRLWNFFNHGSWKARFLAKNQHTQRTPLYLLNSTPMLMCFYSNKKNTISQKSSQLCIHKPKISKKWMTVCQKKFHNQTDANVHIKLVQGISYWSVKSNSTLRGIVEGSIILLIYDSYWVLEVWKFEFHIPVFKKVT